MLAYLSSSGDFYARQGSLTGTFTLEATGVSSIALSSAGGNQPLLGYLQAQTHAFLVKTGVSSSHWSVIEPSGVRSIALAQGTTISASVFGYVSLSGAFFARAASAQAQWTKEASGVNAISLALIGQSDEPLLGYLDADSFYAGEGLTPAKWVDEATGVVQMAVASSTAPGALPVLGCVTAAGELEVLQGPLTVSFSLQARSVTSMALSSVTDS